MRWCGPAKSETQSPNSRHVTLFPLVVNVETSNLHVLLPLTLSFLHCLKSNTSRSAPNLLTSFSHSTLSSLSLTYRSPISKSYYLISQSEGLEAMAGRKPGVIALFDVDGTLTAPRKVLIRHVLFDY